MSTSVCAYWMAPGCPAQPAVSGDRRWRPSSDSWRQVVTAPALTRGARLGYDRPLGGPLEDAATRAMNRRAFLGTLAGSLFATPLAAHAQQAAKVFKIGVITEGGS